LTNDSSLRNGGFIAIAGREAFRFLLAVFWLRCVNLVKSLSHLFGMESVLHENKCPDCLHLEIEGKPVVSNQRGILANLMPKATTVKTKQIDLWLRINFNEEWVDFPIGRLKFGLKGGELRLRLKNGKIPYNSRFLKKELEAEFTTERQLGREIENKQNVEVSLGSDVKGSLKASLDDREKKNRSDKFQLKVTQISTKGKDDNPAWVFANKTGEPVLIGELAALLARMDVIQKPSEIEATFTVAMQDVQLTAAEGLWSPDISEKKKAIIDRGLAKLLLKHKLQPWLSRQELCYE